MERHLIGAIGDVDDTMIPWEVPHSKAYPAMSHDLSLASGIAEQRLIDEIRAVNTKHGTIEYTALLQEMESFKDLPPDRLKAMIDIAINSRRKATAGETEPFPDIHLLLQTLQVNGLVHIALSDGPINLVYLRLKQAKLLEYFELIAGSPSPDDQLFAPEHRMGNKKYTVPVQSMDAKKPNTDLGKLLNLQDDQIRDRYFLYGNSEHSDQGLARRYGMLFYQTGWDKGTDDMRKTLLKYAPERILAGNVGTKANPEIKTHPAFEMVKVKSARELLEDLKQRMPGKSSDWSEPSNH